MIKVTLKNDTPNSYGNDFSIPQKKLFPLRYSDALKGKQSFQTVFNKVQRPNKCILG